MINLRTDNCININYIGWLFVLAAEFQYKISGLNVNSWDARDLIDWLFEAKLPVTELSSKYAIS